MPHLSIGDGWWVEGHTGNNGWLIDGASNSEDHDATDAADADSLYDLLERDIVPRFYDRDDSDIPQAWVTLVKEAIQTVAPRFSARRMLKDYARLAYATVPLPVEAGTDPPSRVAAARD